MVGRRARWSSSASESKLAMVVVSTVESSVAMALAAPRPASIQPSSPTITGGFSNPGCSWNW